MIATGEVEGPAVVENARAIGEQSRRMTKIISQLLDFARQRPPAKASCDLAALAASTRDLVSPLAAKRRSRIALDGASEPVTASVDRGQIQQALTNLIMNALQASPPESEVSVALRRERLSPPRELGDSPRDCVSLVVRDRGSGVAPENLGRIFEPFFTTKDVGDGTGLGLSVAHGIVREHGGWISVESAPGAGSAFAIVLPVEASP